jgi:hypothetical protein
MLTSKFSHLINNVLPAAAEYERAEELLSRAYGTNPEAEAWHVEALNAKRKAAELAIAIDGLTDRAQRDLNLVDKNRIRADVGTLCFYPNTTALRPDALERMRGVANAYKHCNLSDPTLPISSENDVLVVALGYGLEGFGVGKYACAEVVVRDKAQEPWKFLGDVPAVVSAWFRYLSAKGHALPSGPYHVCGLQVHP